MGGQVKPLTMTPEREAAVRRLVDEDRWQVDPGHVYNGLEAMLLEASA